MSIASLISTDARPPVRTPLPQSRAWDLPIDYQRLRHGGAARRLRGVIYRLLVGREGWPLVFRPPVGEGPRGTSPHLYVHLPFCRQICPHCPYNKTRYDAAMHSAYGAALRREMEEYLGRRDLPSVKTLYFGGGTPSVTPDLIRQSIDLVRPFLERGADVGVEVHPADASPQLLDELREMGVNRVSLGVETFRADLLKRLGRIYSPAQAEEALAAAKSAGFACVDVNLICAIPGQSHRDTADELWAISSACRAAGFVRTSPWNYTRRGVAPYSTVTRESYVGFGAGASCKVDGVFWFNTFSIDAYIAQERNRPAVVMEAAERLKRFHWLYWQLYRTQVDADRYGELFGRDLSRDFGPALSALRLAGMARREGRGWRVTELGAVWMHRLQQLFSITYIDEVWRQCQAEAWPKAVVLQ